MPETASKTFYLETFGCQMNVHDSEKVVGTLLAQGYRQVATEEEAGLVLYNTCSIRDKAEQKVFHRLNDFKKFAAQGKRFGVLGCVAQQEGEKIFERAPYVSLVAGSASYRNLPEMLVQLEAGKGRVTGLDDRQTEETLVLAAVRLGTSERPHQAAAKPEHAPEQEQDRHRLHAAAVECGGRAHDERNPREEEAQPDDEEDHAFAEHHLHPRHPHPGLGGRLIPVVRLRSSHRLLLGRLHAAAWRSSYFNSPSPI